LTLASDQQQAASIADLQRTQVVDDVGLSSVERVLVPVLVSAIVKELQFAQPPLRQPAAISVR
jgi:hypothetical protein